MPQPQPTSVSRGGDWSAGPEGLEPEFDEEFGAGVDDHQHITEAAATGRFNSDMENVSVEERGVLPTVAARRAAEGRVGFIFRGDKMQKFREVLLIFDPCTSRHIADQYKIGTVA